MDRWRAMKQWQRWTIIGVTAFFVIGIIGSLTDSKDETISTAAPTTTSSPPTTAAAVVTTVTVTTTTLPAPTTTRATLPPTTAAPTTAAGPKTTFGNGQYRVGVDIAPGTYVAPGGSGCYWERQATFGGGSLGDIIANDLSRGGQVVVTIAASDKGFKTSGCGTWTPG